MKKSSSSQQQQTTTQTDARQVVDGGSVGNSGSGTVAGAVALSGTGNTFNMLDGGLIESAFAYLAERDASGAKQVDSMLQTSRSAVEMAIKGTEGGQNNENSKVMIYALSAVAAVVVLKGFKK